jgi:hypothetical protein
MAARVTTAVYRKNIHRWEQWGRLVVGIALLVAAIVVEPTLGRLAMAATGIVLVVTGVVGWCPACATFGRDLERRSEHVA